jgi:hypothetical protein
VPIAILAVSSKLHTKPQRMRGRPCVGAAVGASAALRRTVFEPRAMPRSRHT